jgi:ABC-type Mn2+/Zn2+ transport system permease subunit
VPATVALATVAVMSRDGVASRRHQQHACVMASGALALGVVLISVQLGSSRDLTAVLVGSPRTVQVR